MAHTFLQSVYFEIDLLAEKLNEMYIKDFIDGYYNNQTQLSFKFNFSLSVY